MRLLPSTKEFVFWFKHQPVLTYSDGELAWTSFNKTAKCFDFPFFGATGADIQKIHPTQKPVILYQWLLENYAKPGQKILDTHLGSGSSAIAAHYFGVDFVGTELDKDYYDAACKRFELATAQTTLFELS
jgi:site-specific DNA-methyltransferase (adenine-specific)